MIIEDHLHRADKQSALKVNPAHNVTDPKQATVQVLANLMGPAVQLGDRAQGGKCRKPLPLHLAQDRIKSSISSIPFIIRVLHPKMKQRDFRLLAQDQTFLQQTTQVCEDCFLFISQSSSCSGLNNRVVEGRAPLGTQNLDPEKTARFRHISELLVEQDSEEKVFPLFNFKVVERGRSSDVLYSPRFQTIGGERSN